MRKPFIFALPLFAVALNAQALTFQQVYQSWLAKRTASTTPTSSTTSSTTTSTTTSGGSVLLPAPPPPGTTTAGSWWRPGPKVRWQIQYAGGFDSSYNVDVYNIDLFDRSASDINLLHGQGKKVICYFSAGSFEEWRPDAGKFPAAVKGKNLDGWAGEKWLDVRNLSVLGPIMQARLDLAKSKGCDGVDPDNVDGYTQDSGFTISAAQQLTYNRFLATEAHKRGLAIGLKNDLDQVAALVPYFDFATNESCFEWSECSMLKPFIDAGKPVMHIEYTKTVGEFCTKANQLGLNSIRKNRNLDAYVQFCS